MPFFSLITGPIEVNTYFIYKHNEPECIVIDPADFNIVKAALAEHNLKLCHILLTHGHFDHTLAVAQLQKEYGAKVYIHKNDAEALHSNRHSLAMLAGTSLQYSTADIELKGGETLSLSGMTLKVIHTPGHTQGSVCYLLEAERTIFSGDTLFRLSVGRTDLPGGDDMQLLDSIGFSLFTLPGDYDVFPGHMRKSKLSFEREHNPIMRLWRPNA